MSRQAIIYLLSFGFSTVAAIVYSFVSNELSIPVIALLFGSVVYLSYTSTLILDVEASISRFRSYSNDLQSQRRIVVLGVLDGLHRPSARVIQDQVSLVTEVGNAIRKNAKTGQRPAIFVGAVSLQTPAEDADTQAVSLIYEDEEEQSPFQIYQGVLEEAASRNAGIVRFISLPTEHEVRSRSSKWANDYLRWLDGQLSQINRNANFFLVDSPRCPKWGTAGARILVGENIFDITRKGGSTIQVRDERISKMQAEKVVQSALSGNPKNVNVYCSDIEIARARFPETNVYDEDAYKDFLERIRGEMKARHGG